MLPKSNDLSSGSPNVKTLNEGDAMDDSRGESGGDKEPKSTDEVEEVGVDRPSDSPSVEYGGRGEEGPEFI